MRRADSSLFLGRRERFVHVGVNRQPPVFLECGREHQAALDKLYRRFLHAGGDKLSIIIIQEVERLGPFDTALKCSQFPSLAPLVLGRDHTGFPVNSKAITQDYANSSENSMLMQLARLLGGHMQVQRILSTVREARSSAKSRGLMEHFLVLAPTTLIAAAASISLKYAEKNKQGVEVILILVEKGISAVNQSSIYQKKLETAIKNHKQVVLISIVQLIGGAYD